MTSHATKMVPEMRTASKPGKTVGIVKPTENEIATVAYQLWIDSGCPIGRDQEHWFRAEAMLLSALLETVQTFIDSRRSSKAWPSSDGKDIGRYGKENGLTPIGSGMYATPAVRISNRAT